MNRERLWLAIVMMFALALYLAQLGDAPLWYDEAGSTWMAELPLPRLIAATAGDTHPPLYLILLSCIQRVLGSSPVAMRLLSVASALVVIPLTNEIAKAIGLTPSARHIGVSLMAISPFQLHFSQEARMYALMQVAVLAMALAMFRRRWLLFALAAASALWTHYYGLIYLEITGLLAFVREVQQPAICADGRVDRARPDHVVIAVVMPALTFTPWLLVLVRQMRMVAGGYWIQPVTPGGVVYVFYTWLFGFTLPEWAQPTGVIVAAGLIAWLTARVFRERVNSAMSLHWLIFAPVTVVVGTSLLWQPILLFRGFAPSVPLLFLLTGWAFSCVEIRRRWYALALTAPMLAAAVIGHYVWNPEHKTGINAWAKHLRDYIEPGDVILHANEGTLMELHPQIGGLPQYIMPRCEQPNLGGLSAETQAAMGMQVADPSALEWRRAWFVWSWAPTVTQCEVDAARTFLQAHPAHALAFPVRNDEYVEANIYLVVR